MGIVKFYLAGAEVSPDYYAAVTERVAADGNMGNFPGIYRWMDTRFREILCRRNGVEIAQVFNEYLLFGERVISLFRRNDGVRGVRSWRTYHYTTGSEIFVDEYSTVQAAPVDMNPLRTDDWDYFIGYNRDSAQIVLGQEDDQWSSSFLLQRIFGDNESDGLTNGVQTVAITEIKRNKMCASGTAHVTTVTSNSSGTTVHHGEIDVSDVDNHQTGGVGGLYVN